MDNCLYFEEVWVIKDHKSYFSPGNCELFTDYDEAVFHAEALEHKAVLEWQERNKQLWDYNSKFYRVITLREAFESYGDGERESSYDDGYSEGVRDGRNEGYEDGYSDGHSTGLTEGHDQGYAEGINDGRNEGYDDGYRDGKEECGE